MKRHEAAAIGGVLGILAMASIACGQPAEAAFDFGPYASTIGELAEPVDVVVADDGSILVVEEGRPGVGVYDRAGKLQRILRDDDAEHGLIAPAGAAVHGASVFVTDAARNQVVVFDLAGSIQTRWGAAGIADGALHRPAGLDADDAHVYVADRGNDRVQVFDHDGTWRRTIGAAGRLDGQLRAPADVAVDGEGRIVVADTNNNRIQVFDAEGTFVRAWGDYGPFPGLLDEPRSVMVRDERIYVTEMRNHRVQVFAPWGKSLHTWGVHEVIMHEGGGKLHYPTSLAIAPDGAFAVVCETIEDRCQVFDRLPEGAEPELPPPPMSKNLQTHFGEYIAADGKLMILADPENHMLFVLDTSREVPIIIGRFGERGEQFGLFSRFSGLDVDLDERHIVVADPMSARLQTFRLDYDPDGRMRFIPQIAEFTHANDLAHALRAVNDPEAPWTIDIGAVERDRDGNWYVLDQANDRLVVLSPEFEHRATWGGSGGEPGRFRRPTDLAFDEAGERLYVVDQLNARVQVFDREGNVTAVWRLAENGHPMFDRPFGVATGADGVVFVTDAGAHRIVRLDEQGQAVVAWGERGSDFGALWEPRGLAVDPAGRLVVVDYGNHRAQIYDADGTWLVTFGAGSATTRDTRPIQRSEP